MWHHSYKFIRFCLVLHTQLCWNKLIKFQLHLISIAIWINHYAGSACRSTWCAVSNLFVWYHRIGIGINAKRQCNHQNRKWTKSFTIANISARTISWLIEDGKFCRIGIIILNQQRTRDNVQWVQRSQTQPLTGHCNIKHADSVSGNLPMILESLL